MSEELRRTAHLLALARLQPGWDHESRGHLGAIKIQLDLLVHLLASPTGQPVGPEDLRTVLDRGMNSIRKFENTMNLRFDATRGPRTPGDLLDVAAHVQRLGGLLEMSARELDVRWSTESPSGPLWIEGGEPALREALTIAAVEMLFLGQPGETLTLKLGTNGERVSLRIEAPRMPSEDVSWLAPVRETLAKFGGGVKTSAALELDLVVPRAAVPR